MTLFYNLGIRLYIAAVKTASIFNRKARLMVKGHRKTFSRLREFMARQNRTIWVHCASLGEFEQGRPVIEELKKVYPEHKIVLTFFSPSGYEIRKNYEGADLILYLPFDTPRNARRFVGMLKPDLTVFIKYEYWLNYLQQLRRGGFRTFIVSAIFRRDSMFFKPYGGMFRNGLNTFERLFVQDVESAQLLAELGITNVTVAGDTRFDRVATIAAAVRQIDILERFAEDEDVFVAGSTWPPDEELLLKLIAAHPTLKFVIAPHEIHEEHISELVSRIPAPAVRYTHLTDDSAADAARVLMLDTVGLLSSVYQYGKYGYIGGGFGAGIHNTLEAATFGLPLAFGPKYAKFREARELIDIGAAVSVTDYPGLEEWLSRLTDDPQAYAEAKAKALSYVAHNRGATGRFVSYLACGSTDCGKTEI